MPISPPMPVRIVSPDTSTFNSHAFLSSIYNPKPFNHISSSTDRVDAELEEASLNLVRGPRDSMSKTGSVKFGKASKRQHQLSSPAIKPGESSEAQGISRDAVPANKITKVDDKGPAMGDIKPRVVAKKTPVPNPVPKPRTFVPSKNGTVLSTKSSTINTLQEQPIITNIMNDVSQSRDKNDNLKIKSPRKSKEKESVVGFYQPIPDVVSMTQKESSVSAAKNIEGDASIKATFRINRNLKASPLSPVEKQKNLINSQPSTTVHPERGTVVLNESSQSPPKSANKLPVISTEVVLNSNVLAKPHSRKHAVKTQFLQHVGKENRLHAELISKFAESGSLEKIPQLRKVKTKEPKSVKELFPDYRYGQDRHQVLMVAPRKSERKTQLSDVANHLTVSSSSATPEESTPLRKKSAPTPPVTHRKVMETVNTEQQPPVLPRKFKGKNATNVLNVQAPSNKDGLTFVRNTSTGHSLGSFHESLRVPWKGPEENNFKRGADMRKSYTKVVCVVNL
ncbi:uncharacterized protein [Palaemon carinicauda]|uniref:uncharacterized protein n=1 Tax=Palaemon carinicauda TaxID=392227 RepID=UPI0035B59990